jgi:hypothetical protein
VVLWNRPAEVGAIGREIESPPGLPDGMISNQKSKFGLLLDDLGMKKVGICILL